MIQAKPNFIRVIIMALCVIIEAAILGVIIRFFSEQAAWIEGVLRLMSTVVVLYIIRRTEHLSSDLMWIILIMMFPVPGTASYLLLGADLIISRTFRSIVKETDVARKYYFQDTSVLRELDQLAPAQKGQFHYIAQSAGFPFYRNTGFDYYGTGEEGFPYILEEMEKAERFIFLEYFIIEPGEMWHQMLEILQRKVSQGVECRVLYDDMGSFGTLPASYARELEKQGIKSVPFNRITPVLGTIMNHRDHRKILVIDGKVAFSGGINLADEYINRIERFGYWKDNVIRIKGEAVWTYTVLFLTNWNALRHEDSNYMVFKADSFPDSQTVVQGGRAAMEAGQAINAAGQPAIADGQTISTNNQPASTSSQPGSTDGNRSNRQNRPGYSYSIAGAASGGLVRDLAHIASDIAADVRSDDFTDLADDVASDIRHTSPDSVPAAAFSPDSSEPRLRDSFGPQSVDSTGLQYADSKDSQVPETADRDDFDGYIAAYGETPLDYEITSQNIYMNILNQAVDYCYIITPYLIIDNELVNALLLTAKRGVDVRILTPGIPDKRLIWMITRSYYTTLMKGGVKIYEYTPGFVHAKVFVSDDKVATVGTINLDYRSLYLHFENGTYLYGSKKILDIRDDYLDALRVSKRIEKGDIKNGVFKEMLLSVLRLFTPLL